MQNGSFNSILLSTVEDEFTIEKSRFLCYSFPVEYLAEIEEKLREMRKLHRKATHVVSAWRLGIETIESGYDDDGEPSQTAGAPMQKVLEGSGLTQILVVAVRYFGGIKLGTGGLVRAYAECAKRALEGADQARLREVFKLELIYDYHFHALIESLLQTEYNAAADFVEHVRRIVYTENPHLRDKLEETTNGRIKITGLGQGFITTDPQILERTGFYAAND